MIEEGRMRASIDQLDNCVDFADMSGVLMSMWNSNIQELLLLSQQQ
jgi:hypothetical protein